MSIQIFTTGGTFDKIYYDALSEFQIGEPMAGEILREAGVSLDYHVQSLLKKDSLDMNEQDREHIRQAVQATQAEQVLIIHGTDTMTQTAAALQGIANKTIIFTGAMQPARMQISDARFNLGLAIGALQCLPHGLYVAMNGRIFPADKVKKNRAQGRFE